MDEFEDTHCFAPPPHVLQPSSPRVVMPAGKHDADTIKAIAQENSHVAINALTRVAESGKQEGAIVTAANAILDRAYGKVGGDAASVNINMMPTRIELVVVPLPGEAAPMPIVLDVDATRKAEPSDGGGGVLT